MSTKPFELCKCCKQKRGWWTLCPGELLLRFRSTLDDGLSDNQVERLYRECGRNINTPSTEILNSYASVPDSSKACEALFVLSICVPFASWVCFRPAFWTRMIETIPVSSTLSFLKISSMFMAATCCARILRLLVVSSKHAHLDAHLRCLETSSTLSRQSAICWPSPDVTNEPPFESDAWVMVVRGGHKIALRWVDVVHGDVVHLQEGSWVLADVRVVQTEDDAALDSWFLSKRRSVTGLGDAEDTDVLHTRSCLLAPSLLLRGAAVGVVTRTGPRRAAWVRRAELREAWAAAAGWASPPQAWVL